MTLSRRLLRRRKLTTFIAAGAAAIALGIGGYAVANPVPGSAVSGSASAAKVVPFHRGQPGPSKVVGQVPAGWRAGTGTIVTGTAANKARAAAVAAYPGGTVNRVVLLSDGEYNVHMIGVNWPHHVFVSTSFTVLGAA